MSYMAQTQRGGRPAYLEVRSRWAWFVGLGVAFLGLGALALTSLSAASLAVIMYIGALMVLGGIAQIVHAFRVSMWSNFLAWLVSGLLYLTAGVIAFFNPLAAMAAMTILFAASLFVAGVLRISVGFETQPEKGWGWIVATGILTLIAAAVIVTGWPANTPFLLGLVLAFDLIFQGAAFIAFGMSLKNKN